LAKSQKGPKVKWRRPVKCGDREEGDELKELQEMSNVSHNSRRVSASTTELHP